jgi:hypothetical protein
MLHQWITCLGICMFLILPYWATAYSRKARDYCALERKKASVSWRKMHLSFFLSFFLSVRSLAFLGQAESPEADTKTRPSNLWPLAKLPCLFPCLQNLRNFHFLNYLGMSTCSIWWSQIIRYQKSPPVSWLGPSYKAHYPFQPSCCTLILRETAQQSVISINLSFPHVAWSLFGSSLHFLSFFCGSTGG